MQFYLVYLHYYSQQNHKMARRKTEPVRNTCPNIDRIINTITSITKEMNNCDSNDSIEDLIAQINNWESDLNSIGVGRYCELESLRSSNASLRDWGHEMYNDAESLEVECGELNGKVQSLESRIKELELELSKIN